MNAHVLVPVKRLDGAKSRLAESLGYDTVWIGDSHLIWREAYVTLTACALATERVRFIEALVF